MITSAIETYAYARAGLLGNPSDGYFGKTISLIVRNFRARVVLWPSARLEIRPSKADMPIFENLDDLYAITRWRGYYGGIRIIQALIVRFIEYCQEIGHPLHDRNFTIEYETTVPLRLGMGGSSAIITAALRALCEFYELSIPLPIQARLILETETRELSVSAGPQDRVIQVYEGLVYMDFNREHMEKHGYGIYKSLNPALLPNIYVAYRTSLSEGTEVFHNNVRARWLNGEKAVIDAMRQWAEIAERGRDALLTGDTELLGRLINENFDLRTTIYNISEGNLEMIRRSRAVGATSNFAGSGGAIVGTYRDERMLDDLTRTMGEVGVRVLIPRILPQPL
ncbi:MAG: GHMP kinase [Bryobacterales bacterium]|nr:GHMP kinase [Bryobacterales bacterium]